MNNRDAVVVIARRTPIGKYGGKLKDMPPENLAAHLIKAILQETQLDPASIEDIILGNTVGSGGNVARVAALSAGLPVEVCGLTIDRQCGSGLDAIILAARLIQAGAGHIYLAGGTESASRAPWKMTKPASLYATEAPQLYTRAAFTPDTYGDPDMGQAAENVAQDYGISRERQDEYTYRSHQRAYSSEQEGRFIKEMVPTPASPFSQVLVEYDESIRQGLTLSKLARMSAAFVANGTVTAGNSCPHNDGAAIVLLMSRQKAQQLKLKPVMQFIDAQVAGVDPHLLGIGPVPAVRQLLHKQGMKKDDVDVVELNEAFASQAVACLQELQIPWEKVSQGGGALALGHPYAASGAILVTRLCAELEDCQGRFGLATMGIGGGMGIAALFKREEATHG